MFGAGSIAELLSQFVEARDLIRGAGRTVEPDLASLAYNVYRHGRHTQQASSPIRAAIVAESLAEFTSQLEWIMANADPTAWKGEQPPAGVYLNHIARSDREIAFVFPGQGAQFPTMLNELAVNFVEVRRAFEQVDRILEQSVSKCVFPPPTLESAQRSLDMEYLMSTDMAQPALGASGVGLIRLLESFGIRPTMTAGHSYGELVALFAANCIDEESLYRLSRDRANAMLSRRDVGSHAEREAMLAARASEEIIKAVISECEHVFVANINGPQQVVLSGKAPSIAHTQKLLEARGIPATPLLVDCAFHTPFMSPASEQFTAACARINFRAPQWPVFCNVTAGPYSADVEAIRTKLVQQITSPVRFAQMIESMYAGGARLFVEVGPSDMLSKLIGEILDSRPHKAIPLQPRGRPGIAGMAHALAALFTSGVNVNPDRLYEGRNCIEVQCHETPITETTWLINGAYARRASCPRRTDGPRTTVAIEWPATARSETPSRTVPRTASVLNSCIERSSEDNGNGACPVLRLDPREFEGPPEHVVPAVQIPAAQAVPTVSSNSVSTASEVVLQFQRNMRELLEKQAEIMRLYLGAGAVGEAVAGRDSEDIIADRRLTPTVQPIENLPKRSRPRSIGVEIPLQPRHTGTRQSACEQPEIKPASSLLGVDGFVRALMRITSEKTGYPASVLGLDAGLEAELGIDSIKRVEIVSAFRREVAPHITEPPSWFIQKMISAATLRDIVSGVIELKQPDAKQLEQTQSGTARPENKQSLITPSKNQVMFGLENFATVLVRITSEKTGYPPSVLGLDARLEAELGIDSIKRVEIVAAFRREVAADITEAPSWFVQRMISAVTLRDVVAGVQELKQLATNQANTGSSGQTGLEASLDRDAGAGEEPDHAPREIAGCSRDPENGPMRLVPTPVRAQADLLPVQALVAGVLVVTNDYGGLADRFIEECASKGQPAVLLDDNVLASRASVAAAVAAVREQFGAVAGIVHLAPLADAPDFPNLGIGEWHSRIDREIKSCCSWRNP